MGADTVQYPQEPDRVAELESLRRRLAESEAREQALREVCGEAYQLAGALGASEEALDNLSAAASGEPIPHKTFLPVVPPTDTELLDWLQEEVVDTIYLDDGRIIDVAGNSVRAAIRAAMKETLRDSAPEVPGA